MRLRLCFCGSVVFRLCVAHYQRVVLRSVDEVGLGVVNDTGRGGVHEGFDSCLLCRADESFGPIHVDFVEQIFVLVRSHWASGMNYAVGLEGFEEGEHRLVVCEVAVSVFYTFDWVCWPFEVEHGELPTDFARCQ